MHLASGEHAVTGVWGRAYSVTLWGSHVALPACAWRCWCLCRLFGDLSVGKEVLDRTVPAMAEALAAPSATGAAAASSAPAAAAAPLSLDSARPTTSRRVPHPTPSEFVDYVLPSPPRASDRDSTKVVSFETAEESLGAAAAAATTAVPAAAAPSGVVACCGPW